MSKNRRMTTKTIAYCALLVALNVAVTHIMAVMPSEVSRLSIGPVFTFLAGMFFGPIAGGLVGFASDFIGSLFTGYGYNPMFCLSPILYGVCGGLFQGFLAKKLNLPRLLLAYCVPVLLGSILWQSFALDFIYHFGFLLLLGSRSVQFAIVLVIDVLLIDLLAKTRVFAHMGVWPPAKYKTQAVKEACKSNV